MAIEKALGKTIVVELSSGEKIEVKKLPLGEYAKLMLALKNMPTNVMNEFQNIDTSDNDATIQAMFGIFGEAWGQVIDILAIGTGIDRDRLETDPDIGLDGGIELFLAVYEVNNLKGVVNKVKNLIKGAAK
ncbi:hypothetical protein [Terrihalobacillus insolitus]|uniref:hypothetical protein n=1 Tax=Terrihalobacillus insolitus TaxID=2950438 RepID=UPI0023422DCA|nr:hypothetical protein [Terrihalobacillus insolitus]MDC3413959.1 hypothetical protein [Terrihalobacillus insolitus]